MSKPLNKISLKQLEHALVSVEEECKRSLGQELHDNLGQQIAAIAYQASALGKKLSAGDVESAKVAADIAIQAQQALMQCKQLAQGLLPFELESNGLTNALHELASRISNSYGITCDFRCENEVVVDDANVALNLYRITQEAINNAIRHAGAKHVTISLRLKKESLRLSISDDGCGFDGMNMKPDSSGMGVKIMQYRANQLDAKLRFLLRAEGGTEVRIKMRAV